MAAPKGTIPPAAGRGRIKGTPNKTTKLIKEMITQALDGVGGVSYLQRQADENPVAFMTLVGKVIPLQITGADDKPLEIKVVNYAGSNTAV